MRYGARALLAIAGAACFVVGASPASASSAASTAAVETAAATLGPNQFVWGDEDDGAPVRIVVNIGEQRLYVYRGETLVAATAVSTGKDGNETPSGSFTILQKEVDHRSNLYDDASMPFMERLTWDGVAIHAGRNPGFPASHGCIRVPTAFAKKLYAITTVGTEVTVIGADGLVAPTPPTVDDSADETAAANRAAQETAAK
ncbi:L,D-transpeptidase family protein [uncultured Sphingomonas sp.]|uniref:L,D-transpeptidase family protein n=1 Tax=uncultured Sphingomonas sp. TaxID=158754 RepID=UPI0035CB473C